MATFEYNALTSAGRLMKGTVEAGSPQEAGELLKQMQLTVNSIEKARPPKPATAIGRNEFLLFNQQLASIAKAGIPLERGLRELAKDVGSARMRKLIEDIAGDLEAGVSIEQAFEKRQKHFPALYGRILKAGVETGRLSEMLTSLNRHLELANQTRRIIFEATAYPAVVLTLGAIIMTGVFLFIIPQFRSIYAEMIEGRAKPADFIILQHIAAHSGFLDSGRTYCLLPEFLFLRCFRPFRSDAGSRSHCCWLCRLSAGSITAAPLQEWRKQWR